MTFDHRPGLARIAQNYGVPAELGRRVTVNGRTGVIVGHDQSGLIVSDSEDHQFIAHPTWRVTYEEAEGASVAAFAEEALQVELLPWQMNVLTRVQGQAAAEAILRRRVTRCVAAGLHTYDGHCDACGVSAK
jgi:hypothetical protein